ncbi:hypothetical protein ACIGEP_16715 [Microbacterium sp. NPDC077663]|uniref:hypothetical protein n=1 Tax=Microbacterium sp. NPDC077663 TaxID=3364189 RepID=UPI0037CB8910
MAKYEAIRPSGAKPICVLGISDVVVLEDEPTVPVTVHRVSAWGKWSRDVAIPDAASRKLAELAEAFDVVWASEWGHNAHTALRGVLDLPAEPWPFLPVQFDKIDAVRRYADGLPWVWLDSRVVDLQIKDPDEHRHGEIIVRLDPSEGIAGLDVAELIARVGGLRTDGAPTYFEP